MPYDELCDRRWSSLKPACADFSVIPLVFVNAVELPSEIPCSRMTSLRLICRPSLITASVPRKLPSVVDLLWRLVRCFSSTFMFPFSKALHHTHTCFCDTTRVPHTPTNWRRIFTGTTPFTRKNRITQRSWTFHDVCSRPVIFKLIARRYDTLLENTDLHVPPTWLNLLSNDAIWRERCCYLIVF
jgi:hypothetical protein